MKRRDLLKTMAANRHPSVTRPRRKGYELPKVI